VKAAVGKIGWGFDRAKYFFEEIDQRAGERDLPLLAVSIYRGVVPRSETESGARSGDLATYKMCEPDDIVINRMSAYQGAVGRAPVSGVVSPEYMVLRVRPGLDANYFGHLVKSSWFVSEMTAWLRGIGTPDQGNVRTPRVNVASLGNIRIPFPPEDEQRVIADFLDAETARIDSLIDTKRRLVRLLKEWEQASLLAFIGDWRNELTRSLRQYGTSVVTGPFGTQLSANEYVAGGVPVINPTHISGGSIEPDHNVTVSESVSARLIRHRLGIGDIVMGRKGDVGRAALVREVSSGWICGSDSIAIRTDPNRLYPEFLSLALQVSLFRQQLEATSTGATLGNVNESNLLALRVPDKSLDGQRAAVANARAALGLVKQVRERLGSQLGLLRERRQALISAAVTGQLQVPRVA